MSARLHLCLLVLALVASDSALAQNPVRTRRSSPPAGPPPEHRQADRHLVHLLRARDRHGPDGLAGAESRAHASVLLAAARGGDLASSPI